MFWHRGHVKQVQRGQLLAEVVEQADKLVGCSGQRTVFCGVPPACRLPPFTLCLYLNHPELAKDLSGHNNLRCNR
jgi:hypothetical protein